MLFGGYSDPWDLLREEFNQKQQEGVPVPAELREELARLDLGDHWAEDPLTQLREKLEALPRDLGFPFVEPNDLEEIRALRPKRIPLSKLALSEAELLDKFHGAWLGRSVGCALGKPVEIMGMCQRWQGIRAYLKERGSWPVTDYIPGSESIVCPLSWRENIRFMESDDDIRYTLIGLLLLEQYGESFTWRDVAFLWNRELTMNQLCTAEFQAQQNFNLFGGRQNGKCVRDISFIREFNNPYREWIGAQIRADFFGWACAGNPELAAEFAWRDASWTHVKNGIYGEMFIAAVQAAAFVESDPVRLIEIGLGEIPANCRLADALRRALAEIPKHDTMESFMPWVDAEFAEMSPVHTINNAVICAAALVYGKGSPDAAVCAAVMGGLDTDCNGATVGAIAGIVTGHRNFGGTLAGRLNDTIRAEFGEFREVKMKDLAERTLKVYQKLQ